MACIAAHVRNTLFVQNGWTFFNKVIPQSFVRHGSSITRIKQINRWGPVKPPASQKFIQPIMYEDEFKNKLDGIMPDDFRHVYPEFIPDPDPETRNRFREKLERKDMLARRTQIDIPEFYVGSILAVTLADPNASGQTSRFLGICIDRGGCGLRAWFTLRNVVDNLGVEINYEMYCPLVVSIEIIRLEKRLDRHLYYLRDSPPEFSTFPQDLDAEQLPVEADVPVNNLQVSLRARPWTERWELKREIKGMILPDLPIFFHKKADKSQKPWEKYDLMKEYRDTIPEEEQLYIYKELLPHLPRLNAVRRKIKRVKLSPIDKTGS